MSGFFIGGEPPTPEQVAELREQQEKRQMAQEAFINEMNAFVEGLSPRHLYLLKQLIQACYDDNGWTARQIGYLNGMLKWKHDVDPDSGLPEGADFFSDLDVPGKDAEPDEPA